MDGGGGGDHGWTPAVLTDAKALIPGSCDL